MSDINKLTDLTHVMGEHRREREDSLMESETHCDVKESEEMVDHPRHYQNVDPKYECIKIIHALDLDFNVGTAFRYLYRAGNKTIVGDSKSQRIEDLKKAIWYLQDEVNELESDS